MHSFVECHRDQDNHQNNYDVYNINIHIDQYISFQRPASIYIFTLTQSVKSTILIQIVKNNWKYNIMSARCELTGKGKQFGHNVSFSLRRTKRVFKPNLQKKTFAVDGQKITMTLCTKAIRTLRKKGIL